MMNDIAILPGTEIVFSHEPGERWRVVGPSAPGRFGFASYVCEQIAGDPTKYAASRNTDGTIDMDADALIAALEGE